MQDLAADIAESGGSGRGAARQAQYVRAEIGQHHAGERHGAEAVKLENTKAGERFHAFSLAATALTVEVTLDPGAALQLKARRGPQALSRMVCVLSSVG